MAHHRTETVAVNRVPQCYHAVMEPHGALPGPWHFLIRWPTLRVLRRTGLVFLFALAFAQAVRADPVTVRGLTFSDEMGGFTILNAWGSGSLADPITVVEEVTAVTGTVLVVRGLGPESGNPIPTAHPACFVLRKIVINATNRSWNIYDVELQKVLGTTSDIFDGLSFGQSSQAGRPFPSDRFAQSALLEEPSDNLSFFDGIVAPGQTVTITFVVTVTGPVPEFYILQRPNRPLVWLPQAERRRASYA